MWRYKIKHTEGGSERDRERGRGGEREREHKEIILVPTTNRE